MCITSLPMILKTDVWLSKYFGRAIFHAAGTRLFWLCLLGTIVAALLPRFVVKFVCQYYYPDDIQISREAEKRFKKTGGVGGGQIEMHPITDVPPGLHEVILPLF